MNSLPFERLAFKAYYVKSGQEGFNLPGKFKETCRGQGTDKFRGILTNLVTCLLASEITQDAQGTDAPDCQGQQE